MHAVAQSRGDLGKSKSGFLLSDERFDVLPGQTDVREKLLFVARRLGADYTKSPLLLKSLNTSEDERV